MGRVQISGPARREGRLGSALWLQSLLGQPHVPVIRLGATSLFPPTYKACLKICRLFMNCLWLKSMNLIWTTSRVDAMVFKSTSVWINLAFSLKEWLAVLSLFNPQIPSPKPIRSCNAVILACLSFKVTYKFSILTFDVDSLFYFIFLHNR